MARTWRSSPLFYRERERERDTSVHPDTNRLCSQQKCFKCTQHRLLPTTYTHYKVTVKDSDILDIVHILDLSKNNCTKTGYSPFWDWRGKIGFLPCWIGQEGLAAVSRLNSCFQPVRQGSILMPCSHLKRGQVHTSMLCVSDKSRQWTFSRTLVQVIFEGEISCDRGLWWKRRTVLAWIWADHNKLKAPLTLWRRNYFF